MFLDKGLHFLISFDGESTNYNFFFQIWNYKCIQFYPSKCNFLSILGRKLYIIQILYYSVIIKECRLYSELVLIYGTWNILHKWMYIIIIIIIIILPHNSIQKSKLNRHNLSGIIDKFLKSYSLVCLVCIDITGLIIKNL